MQDVSPIFGPIRPLIMGIVNITPDSFSDGGGVLSDEEAAMRAVEMAAAGADIIDIGGESSRPGSEPVSLEEELRRVIPAITAIRKVSDIPISIDTTKSAVALRAMDNGANMINDISAGTIDPEIFNVAAKKNVPICLMHMRGTPKTMQAGEIHYDDVVGEIMVYLKGSVVAAQKAGVPLSNIIIDPGIGFGKEVQHNIDILKGLKDLKSLGVKLLVGTSRKSFIGKLLDISDPKDRLEGTLATIAIAARNGADIVRVHDVKAVARFLKMWRILA